jgi:hypothetical protein
MRIRGGLFMEMLRRYNMNTGMVLQSFYLKHRDILMIETMVDVKADKFERDARLLEQGLIDEPNNGRYMFLFGTDLP